jgi:hypothetical protein
MNIKIRKSLPVCPAFGFHHAVYMAVLFVVLGLGYALMYRCVDNFMTLRRNADDIAHTLRAGEQWRADVRSAAPGRWETNSDGPILRLARATSSADFQSAVSPIYNRQALEIAYRFSEAAVFRRAGSGPWVQIVSHVQSSSMESDPRQKIMPCKWELELQPRVKTARVRPLFTFIAVPKAIP